MIVTDNKEPVPDKPDNVIIKYKTLEEVETTAAEKLGFPVKIATSYKLCDFKPAYGFLFPEILKEFKFWGHGDIDVIYGNIRKFISKKKPR